MAAEVHQLAGNVRVSAHRLFRGQEIFLVDPFAAEHFNLQAHVILWDLHTSNGRYACRFPFLPVLRGNAPVDDPDTASSRRRELALLLLTDRRRNSGTVADVGSFGSKTLFGRFTISQRLRHERVVCLGVRDGSIRRSHAQL